MSIDYKQLNNPPMTVGQLVKWKGWMLIVSAVSFSVSLWTLISALGIFGTAKNGIDILTGIIFLCVGRWFMLKALHLQDDFWYRLHYEKTGDDFEHRYCKCVCGKT
jgi:hypothetical protein